MNKTLRVSKFVLAALFALPACALAADKGPGCGDLTITGVAAARVHAEAAIGQAEERGQKLSTIPVEFAGVTVMFRYGVEPVQPQGASIAQILWAKGDLWKSAASMLRKEKERLQAEMGAQGRLDGDAVREILRLGQLIQAAEAILSDIEADLAFAEGYKEAGQRVLDRKAALCRFLTRLKR